jgi:hypothetical protein
MESIISALISAAAAIAVAFISRTPTKTATGSYIPRLQGSSHGKWVGAMFLLASWLIISPIAIHHDFPGINGFALLALTAIVAAIWPINGWEAAAWVFGLHALNSVAEPIARLASHYQYPAFGGYTLKGLFFVAALASANALVVALLSQWRLKTSLGIAVRTTVGVAPIGEGPSSTTTSEPTHNASANGLDLSLQLERLAKLRASGELSEAEFLKAKKKILGDLD